MDIRKTIFTKEIINADEMGKPCAPITRVAAMAVVRNTFAGIAQDDLSQLFDVGAELGKTLTQELVQMLPASPICYGKAALVGSSGAMEHGAAVLHPKLGKPVRQAVGGGKSLMPSNHKVGAWSGIIDLPLGHKNEARLNLRPIELKDSPRCHRSDFCVSV